MKTARIGIAATALFVALACGRATTTLDVGPVARHSSSIALSADQKTLFVVNPESDSVAFIDVASRKLVKEVALGPSAPQVDGSGRYWPSVEPRGVAESPGHGRIYVVGRRSSTLHVLDSHTGSVIGSVPLCAESSAVLVSPDESSVYASCANEAEVVRVAADSLTVVATASVASKPWGLAWSADGSSLLVSHLLGPGVTVLDPQAMTSKASWPIADGPAVVDARIPHGPSRGLYDVVPRPGSPETWVVHMMLGIDTAQPALNFENTAFSALSILEADGSQDARLAVQPKDVPGAPGQFGDVTADPRAADFTPDGAYLLVADQASEDVLAVDARGRVEASLLRPLPGHMPEGIVVSADGKTAYLHERNSNDVAVIALNETGSGTGGFSMTVDGAAIPTVTADPMPADMRAGQHVFFSSNSDEMPISTDHWVACASCHIEGRSDAVTWRFAEGPRDTPSNAGGVLETGFLLHTAARRSITDYWHTINEEQGGHFTDQDPALLALLQSLTNYVNHAVPLPVNPRTDPALVAKGKEIFNRPAVGCASCHTGAAFTDSGQGNPTLDLGGTVTLHDVGTCVTSAFPDATHTDVAGHPRQACLFDTPTLRGVSESAPYLHDGSAPTLLDVLLKTKGKMGDISSLSPSDLTALVEYLRSL
jgi:DNA-binding beta-propeller fold protein YncE